VLAAVACLIALGWCGVAAAQYEGQVSRSVAVERFRPLPVQRSSLLAVETSDMLPHATPSVGVVLHGADDPLEAVERRGDERRVVKLVDERVSGEIGVGFGLFDQFSIGLGVPLVYQRGSVLLDRRGRTGPLQTRAFGDVQIAPRWQVVAPRGRGSVGVAVSSRVFAPLGDPDSYNSSDALRVEPRAAVDWRPSSGTIVSGNVGWEVRPRRVVLDRRHDDGLTWGLGLQFPLGMWRIDGVANLLGDVPVDRDVDAGNGSESFLEVLAGFRAGVTERVTLQLAGGTGLTSAIGAPSTRVVVGVEYTPVAVDTDDDTVVDPNDACPEQSEDLDGFRDGDGCPDPDNDGDGISDEEDECPHEPEDPDGFEDSDGCPDPDNDGDGISDVRDVCPREAGAEKKDGCPFVDTDGDGISDARDECPEKPEDEDGFRDGDGCPDPDNDGDGIADEEDECPSEPETVNGVDDEDGCPDEGASGVEVSEGEIEIEDRVFFDTDRATIKQKSYSVLEEVASALEANPEIEKVRIEGHTDADGRDLYNLALSQRRSNAVREFLVDRGVDPSRLESKGYGEAEPIASNDTEEGRRKNRRVEMTILEVEE